MLSPLSQSGASLRPEMSVHALLLLLCGATLLSTAAGAAGSAANGEADAVDGDDPPQDAGPGAAAPPPSEPLCPTTSTHFQCDLRRCVRYNEFYTGGVCSRVCAELAPTCLHRKYVCDGVPDCEDGSDERDCLQCSLDAFPCDGVCRRKELVCDSAYR